MIIKVTLKGSLVRHFGNMKKQETEVPDNCTCREALCSIGIDPETTPRFGFVVRNGMKCKLDDRLSSGDELKAWSKITGG